MSSGWIANLGIGATGVIVGFVLGRLTSKREGGFLIDWRLRILSRGDPDDDGSHDS